MKTIVITGVSRGIGQALAERFLQNGDFVIGTSTSGQATIEYENLIVLPLDLANRASIESCAASIQSLNKPIDILINNAGIWSGVDENPTIRVDLLRKVLEVNLFGTIEFTERITPRLSVGSHIVNISSRMGSLKLCDEFGTNWPDYKISKCALNMVTRIWADRLKGKITVSSVHPGWVQTDMGGDDADLTPAEAAEDIFTLATSHPESGQFWFKGEKYPW
jgi:NAD(P)-dependent dehydrogenase (short-subunit alcohol dehydrogenase family)